MARIKLRSAQVAVPMFSAAVSLLHRMRVRRIQSGVVMPNARSFARGRLIALCALALFLWGTRASAADKISPEALKKVKAATVHIKVTFAHGDVSEGTGFATRLRGLVVTNAHVVGMLDNDSPKPKKIEVTFNSGETNSKTIE